ncbi:hypothetical protein E2F46_01460 [Luteimonas aestuarii]|uniref:Uncharacterized protein n=1 Tax=Luteimonas aestuarii TaxID=453837 RepID=A0A4R5U4C8_9GAMM|nr:hypothetical protein [Luteimonas aestuarii]TDK28576.1 hypothetical protein E2F46_01460 [Luteimonas aestuarii]
MPVSPPLAYRLLNAFGAIEALLKQQHGFLGADGNPAGPGRTKAKANWDAVDAAVRNLRPADFFDHISQRTKDKMLGGARNRPQMQFVRVNPDGTWRAEFEDSELPAQDSLALVVAMRRVRNNLFHGGKAADQPGRPLGDDDEWAQAALEVAEHLHGLLDRGELRPIQAP